MTRSLATLTDLVAAVRQAVDVRIGWTDTAELVADQLRAHLPGPEILTPDQRLGRPDRVAGHLLLGAETAISLHIYGTDISRVGSSARRYYN
jgi:3-mercaptopropionate dioxygenase